MEMSTSTRNLSFPKSRRLTEAWQFDRVRKDGRAQHGNLLMLAALAGKGVDRFRAGFVTSRKIGGAVARNRVRRRLREIVRKHQHEIVESRWVVTVARPDAARASYGELEDEWLRLAKRASILAP
jgi:ribonuclease P protein component